MVNIDKIKPIKIIFNVIYVIGVIIVLCLSAVALFGSNEAVYPDSMMLYSWRNYAFFCLAFGTIPMLLACIGFYKFNNIKRSKRKKFLFLLIFLPGFICALCALFIIGIIIFMIIRGYMHHLDWINSHY